MMKSVKRMRKLYAVVEGMLGYGEDAGDNWWLDGALTLGIRGQSGWRGLSVYVGTCSIGLVRKTRSHVDGLPVVV